MKVFRSLWTLLAAVAATSALAQYPNKPVKLVVPFPAGSATDLVARLVGRELQDALGQPFVIDNKPGAQGSIAADSVAKSAPDGYTILVTTNTQVAANVSLFKALPYDPVKDFQPIVRISANSLVLMVKPNFPARTPQEFIAHMKTQPNKFSGGYGSSSSQVCVSKLKSMGGFDAVEVPYKGIPLAVNDLLGGSIDFTFVDLGNALSQAKGGALRAIAVTSAKRSPLAPDWPALAETLPGYDITAWFALVAPTGMPKDAVQKVHDATIKAIAKADVQQKLGLIGMTAWPLGPEELGGFIKLEIAKWARLVKDAGIQPE